MSFEDPFSWRYGISSKFHKKSWFLNYQDEKSENCLLDILLSDDDWEWRRWLKSEVSEYFIIDNYHIDDECIVSDEFLKEFLKRNYSIEFVKKVLGLVKLYAKKGTILYVDNMSRNLVKKENNISYIRIQVFLFEKYEQIMGI